MPLIFYSKSLQLLDNQDGKFCHGGLLGRLNDKYTLQYYIPVEKLLRW